jgi:hypothetical protein
VQPGQLWAFDDAVDDARDGLASPATILWLVGLAAMVTLLLASFLPSDLWPAWSMAGEQFNAAGWWQLLVSIPLFLVLLFGWFARVAFWARFLAGVARLNLRIVPAHPDRLGGMGFIGQSTAAFAGVAFAIGATVAGRLANVVLHGSGIGGGEKLAIAFDTIVLLAIFTAPLLAFTPKLLRARQQGILQYGALASSVGRALEQKWLQRAANGDDAPLASPDFSAMADLSQVVANANAMRTVPVDLISLIVLAGGILLPFVPIVLMTVPASVVFSALGTLLP